MSESAALAKEAAVKLSHIGSILRAAALESQNLVNATEFWSKAKSVEGLAEEVRQMAADSSASSG